MTSAITVRYGTTCSTTLQTGRCRPQIEPTLRSTRAGARAFTGHSGCAVITSAGDALQIVSRDQRMGGGGWQTLGTWTFPAGWNRVVLVRRAPAGAVVVADAVRVRDSSTP